MLHVPSISKPLLSISQLLADNDIYVEFNCDSCLVKALGSHQILLQGIRHNGLYVVTSSSPQVMLCEKVSLQQCHRNFCHDSDSVIQHLITSKSISYNKQH
jgi:hypothetical protein